MSKRSLLATLLGMLGLLAASGANAGTITVDLPTFGASPEFFDCGYGVDCVVTVTVETDGTEVANFFDAIGLEVGWNPDLFQVKNAGVLYLDGHSVELVTQGPGAGGFQMTGAGGGVTLNAGPGPENLCSVTGDRCDMIS